MKRNKIVALAVVVMMMVGAVVLMSCSNCPGEGDCSYDGADPLGSLAKISEWCFGLDDAEQAKTCFGDYATASGKLECGC